MCRCGGIGRRGRLKIYYRQLCAGSSPAIGTLSSLHESQAAMAELVDALDSGSSRGNSVDVRVILAAIAPHKRYNMIQ